MKIRAKIVGELTMHGPGVHWIHQAGDVRDFTEEVGKKILTNKNYEKTDARQPTPLKEKTTTAQAVVKKSEPDKKEKKEHEVNK